MAGEEVAVQGDGAPTLERKGREGARWINERPTPEEFAKWAKDNIPVAEGLEIEHYVGGIVLIPAVDSKSKYVANINDHGEPLIAERPELVYVPYAKVETRLKYFWDLLEQNEEKWIGVIEPIETPRPALEMLAERVRDLPNEGDELPSDLQAREVYKPTAVAAIVHQLPPGFFLMPVPLNDSYSYSLCCSYRVAIYEKGADADARPVREGRGTKQVALLVSGWGQNRGERVVKLDENALMKAETGAIGRALGAAGIFTIPGSGIATAEDMLEQAAAPETTATTTGAGPAAPEESPAGGKAREPGVEAQPETDEQVRVALKETVGTLREDFPEAHEAFGQWCAKRRPAVTTLDDLEGPALRGVRTKVEKLLGDVRSRQQARGEETAAQASPAEPKGQAPAAEENAAEEPQGASAGSGEQPALI